MPALLRYYGSFNLWNAALGTPAKVGSTVRDYAVSQDSSTAVFLDQDMASGTSTGKLMAISALACKAALCAPVTLATGVTPAQVGYRVSTDGKYVLALVRDVNPLNPGKVIVVTMPSGGMRTLSTGVQPRSAMMTPDGQTVAWVEGANEIAVADSASGVTVGITSSAPVTESAEMIDAGTYVTVDRALGKGATGTMNKVTATATTPLNIGHPDSYFVSQAVPGTTNKYLFYSLSTATSGSGDLSMVDLTSRSFAPVPLGSAVLGAGVNFSDDGTMVWYFDNYDPGSRIGDAWVVAPATPQKTLVASGLRACGFIPNTTRFLYVNAPDPNSGAGVLTLLSAVGRTPQVEQVGVVNFGNSRMSPLRTYYTQKSGTTTDGVWDMSQP
jgi:hypothetical protein